MPDDSEVEPPSATPFWRRPQAQLVLAGSGILAVGLIAGGYLLGDGLTRATEPAAISWPRLSSREAAMRSSSSSRFCGRG